MKTTKYVTQNELQEVFELIDGELWRKRGKNGKQGLRSKGGKFVKNILHKSNRYCTLKFKGRTVSYHKVMWILVNGDIPEGFVLDHIDGNTLNNTVSNLRLVTKRQNDQNKGCHRNGKLPGASYNKRQRKWLAQIQIDGKGKFLGYFDTEQRAHDAYKKCIQDRGVA